MDEASALDFNVKRKNGRIRLKPLAKIVSYADAAHEPEWFTTVLQKHYQLQA